MKLIYGTYNPAKLKYMNDALKGLDIEIIGLKSFNLDIEESAEDWDSPLQNAKQKALYYYSKLKKPVFSCDSGLYFKNVSDDIQPGAKIARVNGKRLSDKEMMEYYRALAEENGGKLTAYYADSICLVFDEKTIICDDGQAFWSEDFYIVDKPHEKLEEGFPLNSISVDIKSGQYYNDIENKKYKYSTRNGFYDFFKKVLEKI